MTTPADKNGDASPRHPFRGTARATGFIGHGIGWILLSADCQRVLAAWVGRARLSQEALTCQEMPAGFGMEPVPARVEVLRSKAKRLVARDWAAGHAPGRFTLAPGAGGPACGS
jgi:hypothetical protein